MSYLRCLVWDLSEMSCFHVNLPSRVMPRYLTESLLGIVILLMVTWGQVCFRSVKVTRADLFSLILKPHLWNHFSIESRHRWRVNEVIIYRADGSEYLESRRQTTDLPTPLTRSRRVRTAPKSKGCEDDIHLTLHTEFWSVPSQREEDVMPRETSALHPSSSGSQLSTYRPSDPSIGRKTHHKL